MTVLVYQSEKINVPRIVEAAAGCGKNLNVILVAGAVRDLGIARGL
jgi:hypothetical protein